MATLRAHNSTEYWKKTDLMVKPASYPIAVGYDVPSVDTIHRPLTLDLSEVSHEDRVYWAVRRAQDILLSSLALVVLSPLLLITYAAIWIDSPGASPIFTQQRVGRNGKLFKMYKFRTMCPEAEQKLKDLMEHNEKDGPVFKMKTDPRITRVGKVLRKTSIDELPQLFNVLKGEMSIVGPRPALPREVTQYTAYEWQRLYVTPGLSCYWQIAPHRDQLSFEEWMDWTSSTSTSAASRWTGRSSSAPSAPCCLVMANNIVSQKIPVVQFTAAQRGFCCLWGMINPFRHRRCDAASLSEGGFGVAIRRKRLLLRGSWQTRKGLTEGVFTSARRPGLHW